MFIDIHLHVGRVVGMTRLNGETYCTPEQLIAKLDEAGIDKGVLLPGVSPECRYHYTPPEDVLDICTAYPGRFIPFCNVDPRSGENTPTSRLDRFLDHYKSLGCKGVGEVTANLAFDDPMVHNLFAACQDYEMPVTFHVGPKFGGCYGLVDELGLPGLERALKKFQGLKFIGHSQPFWAEISTDVTEENRNRYPKGPVTPGRVVELMRNYPNLYGDLSAGSGHNAVSRDPDFGYQFLTEFQDRLFFGTDICAPSTPTPLVDFLNNAVEEGKISREVYEKIAWKNAARILKLEDVDA